ncbi:MAG TPA: COX15/CtaA family protein [Gemmatimonadales bacterium]|jgi:heme A synthase|nr:COX15/CtaA family protein [Gemmatimonadales bacterium]
MPRRYTLLAWTAAACTYLLIVLGAVVRITGSGMGCGDHWPLCNGRLFPPLDDLGTVIEWSHRLAAALVSVLVVGLAGYAWWLRRFDRLRPPPTAADRPGGLAFVALALLILQVGLGAVTVKLALPPWTVILHLGTAMLLLAVLLIAARGARLTPGASPGNPPGQGLVSPGLRPGLVLLPLAFVTVLFGALTANLGAAAACSGFPLCNGAIFPSGGGLVLVHWTHRLLAYSLFGYVVWWALRSKGRGAWGVVALVALQVAVGAATVLLGLPSALQAAHVAVGTAVWAGVVLATR